MHSRLFGGAIQPPASPSSFVLHDSAHMRTFIIIPPGLHVPVSHGAFDENPPGRPRLP
jgi:hypothetical protein